MRIGWIGFHMEGLEALRAVLERKVPIEAVLTLEPSVAVNRSGAADYEGICRESQVPLFFVRDINDARSLALLRDLSLDLAFVIGWTQLVRSEAMALVPGGMIGAHASLLPRLRGRAPINWALIRGLGQTGNSLIWLAEKADRGNIIDQTVIPIGAYDTCASLYDKVAESNRDMILRVLPDLRRGERPGTPQLSTDEADLPRRRPEDGIIDWSHSSRQIYDFIRALTRPYPGAFGSLDHCQYRIWHSALVPGNHAIDLAPGEVIGPVISPKNDACGVAVACGTGAVVLLELEDDTGHVLTGHALSDQPWTGKRWSTCR